MNKKQIVLFSLISLMVISGTCLWSSIFIDNISDDVSTQSASKENLVRTANSIPFDYYQDIEIGKDYIYNVTSFGTDSVWNNFTGGQTDWKTDTNEQIYINFTGFFDRDTNVPGDTFPDTEMPWINISIFESGALLNYTNVNVSNSEVSRNLGLGFANFQPGFLITVNHTNWIKANATLEANGASGLSADLNIEESYNFLIFDFVERGGSNQKIKLIYSRITGLLINASISSGVYRLDIYLDGYTLNYETQYIYNVDHWGKSRTDAFWYAFSSPYFLGVWSTNEGGQIKINFTGDFGRDPGDWGDIFPYIIPWFELQIWYKGNFGSINTFTLDNVSNSEAELNMVLGYNDFNAGFRLVGMDNITWIKQKALEEANPGGMFATPGVVSLEETDLTIKTSFNEIDGMQKTSFIYEKITGLLLWCDTETQNYRLVMAIEGYELDEGEQTQIVDDDDDDDDKKKKAQGIPSYSITILSCVVIVSLIVLVYKLKRKTNLKTI